MTTITDPFGTPPSETRADDRLYCHVVLSSHMISVATMADDLRIAGGQDAKYLAAVRTLAAVAVALDALDME